MRDPSATGTASPQWVAPSSPNEPKRTSVPGRRRAVQQDGHGLGLERLPVEPRGGLAGSQRRPGSRFERIGRVVEVGTVAAGQNGIGTETFRNLRDAVERSRRRLQGHKEVLGHRHDLTQIEPAKLARRELTDVEVVLFVGVRRRFVIPVDDGRVARDRREARDDVEIRYTLGTARIARVRLGVIVHQAAAGRQFGRHQLLYRRGSGDQVVRRRLGQAGSSLPSIRRRPRRRQQPIAPTTTSPATA